MTLQSAIEETLFIWIATLLPVVRDDVAGAWFEFYDGLFD
jgi:hypothetical protein